MPPAALPRAQAVSPAQHGTALPTEMDIMSGLHIPSRCAMTRVGPFSRRGKKRWGRPTKRSGSTRHGCIPARAADPF